MRILDKYVLSAFLPSFITCLPVVTFAAVESGMSSASGALAFLPEASLFAASASSAYALSDLAKRGELRAMHAAGISLFRIAAGPVAVAMAVCVVYACVALVSGVVDGWAFVWTALHVCIAGISLAASASFAERYGQKEPLTAVVASTALPFVMYFLAALAMFVAKYAFR